MNIAGLSNETLQALHQLIREKLAADDAAGNGPKRYGVREYPDWRTQADEFEAQMTERNLQFEPIDWS